MSASLSTWSPPLTTRATTPRRNKNIPVTLRGGPTISTGPNTNPVVGNMLIEAAGRMDVPFQPDPSGNTAPNDARVIQTGDSGAAAASVGIPQRNMHTQVEVCALSDLENTARLLVEVIRSIRERSEARRVGTKVVVMD